MDELFEHGHPSKSMQKLAKSIHSLVGFKTYLTPSWVESVCHIIKDSQSANPIGDSGMKSSMFDNIKTEIDESLSEVQGEIDALSFHLSQLNLKRRQALNEYLDLKGNIRVFCRVRPFLQEETYVHSRTVINSDSSNVFLKIAENKAKQYSFDKVFTPHSTQEEVFSEIEPMVKSVLDGYNVCIFAYGQTGTGKTYTMEGRPDCPGMVPRGIEALFEQALESNYRYQFTFSMLEIYMGSIRDLLVPRSEHPRDHKAPNLSIQMDPNGGIEIENLVAIKVNDFKQVKRLYKLGSRLRSTASTKSNSASSRSHCLIRISLSCFGAHERRRETNKIWMVDLGGSERLLKTQARGRRLEEGKAINLSLSALGDVMSALHGKKSHVPYRNSKLTQVLRDSLGSDSKTIMLVHVSPKEEDMCETICSLGFATRVRSIHLGSEDPIEVRTKKEIAMTELLQQVKYFESKRQDIKRDIERLKHLAKPERLGDQHLKASYSSNELGQCNMVKNVQIRDSTEVSAKIPRFMRPTICSKIKTGIDKQTSVSIRQKPPVHSQKKRSLSVNAESVTSKAKGVVWWSDYGSEHSISTSSYFEWKHDADNGTECSQGTSEFEIKEVIFPELEKSPRSLRASFSHGSANLSEDNQIVYGAFEVSGEATIAENHRKDIIVDEIESFFVGSETDTRGDSKESDHKNYNIKFIPDHKQEFTKPTNKSEDGNESTMAQAGVPASEQNMILLENSSEGLRVTTQHKKDDEMACILSMRSQRLLFVAKDIPMLIQRTTALEDTAEPATNFHKKKHEIGITQLFLHTIKVLWASALLGLGIHRLGFGHDFYNGLTL